MAAEAAVGFAIETLGNMLLKEAKFLAGVSDQVEDLKFDLERLRSFLLEAESRHIDQRSIQVWILHSRQLAYSAEDLLEDYAFKIALQRQNILKRTVCFMKECYIRRSFGSEIQTLTSKISRLTKSFREYGIRPYKMEREGSSSSSQQQLRRTSSLVVEGDFIKLDNDDVEMLVGHLVNENNSDLPKYKVASIFGMGGLGKTTLAKKVYNHDKVKRYFDSLVWVCISQQWQKRDILQEIMIKFLPQQRKEILKRTDQELIREISQTLTDKKCLVVLDDIWSNQPWESIKEAFPITEKGSKLLLTTRNESVALHIDPNGFHHEPSFLNDDESFKLLKIKANIGDDEEKQRLGKEMVKHCEGLPLAVVVLGGILATKRDIKEWETVHRNVRAHIVRGKQGEVEKILALSYNDLPPKLKACFLYLGRFPEDSNIDVEKLYQLWIAEGMILMEDKMSTEESMLDVAERYLGELVERSMVQVKLNVDMEKISRFSYCHLHDLLRDLSLKKAKETNFFSFVRFGDGSDDQVYGSSSSTHQIHRLVIHFNYGHADVDGDHHKFVPPPKTITKHLRSLRLLEESDYYVRIIGSQFSLFQMLRVLEIEGLHSPAVSYYKEFYLYVIDCLDFSKGISNLIHLRYLSVSGSLFSRLPSSLVNLKQLQAIDLRGATNLWLPNILWNMRELKYLYLPYFDLWQRRHKLRLNGLNELEILEGFDSSLCSCEGLIKLKKLRSLQGKFDVKDFDIVKILDFISDSKSLLKVDLRIVSYDDSFGTTEYWSAVKNKLFYCRKLTKLGIRGRIGNLPKYEAGFGLDLVDLTLKYSKIEDDPMETLGKLPNLKSLHLEKDSFLGTEMQCRATDFPQIRKLQLEGLYNLEKWIIVEGAMPNLSVLEIGDCKKLEMIPDGLRFITTLEELEVFGMPREFRSRLQVIDDQEGEDFYKIRHVPSVADGCLPDGIRFSNVRDGSTFAIAGHLMGCH